ncbi:hypothetical protein [Rhabdothermincola sediminis]|uniref:hypothetical protein n=1 Tax=Rhabdothermincola sediminis TaxID=2751370 RepID=UPI001AA0A60E|nr:hypothetical protein [Rhabdothermincola sediminis]
MVLGDHGRAIAWDISIIAGGNAGYADGSGLAARFDRPVDVAISADGAFAYIADAGNGKIRKVDLSTAMVSTLAELSAPNEIAIGGDNALYVTSGGSPAVWGQEDGPDAVWKVPLDGSAPSVVADGFYNPRGIAFGSDGTMWVVDTYKYSAGSSRDVVRISHVAGGSRVTDKVFNSYSQMLWFSGGGSLATAHDKLYFVTAGLDNKVKIWDPGTDQLVETPWEADGYRGIAVDRAGTRLS